MIPKDDQLIGVWSSLYDTKINLDKDDMCAIVTH